MGTNQVMKPKFGLNNIHEYTDFKNITSKIKLNIKSYVTNLTEIHIIQKILKIHNS